jgi:hypothetical protein
MQLNFLGMWKLCTEGPRENGNACRVIYILFTEILPLTKLLKVYGRVIHAINDTV